MNRSCNLQCCVSAHCKRAHSVGRQSGQALVYGLFMLMAGAVALIFLFNVGQLTHEKTKLVNTGDAVAYSAGIMHARAMNHMAYTNRALVADEIAIAQSVSLASWGEYLQEHGQNAMALGCNPENLDVSEPVIEQMVRYAPICIVLGTAAQAQTLGGIAVHDTLGAAVNAAEVSKDILKKSQTVVKEGLVIVRAAVMQEVANANYANDGAVTVELRPLRDTFTGDGETPSIINAYSGEGRKRMRDLEVNIVNKDGFTPTRNWSDQALVIACAFDGIYFNEVDRSGGTQLIGFDEWQSSDQANYHRWHLVRPRFGTPYCSESVSSMGTGRQTASASGSKSVGSDNWAYSGVPSYMDLSEDALEKIDPRVQFVIRVFRNADQVRTTDGRSAIHSTPRLANFQNGVGPAGGSGDTAYVSLAASETFFQRPNARADGKKELASLFNPYWQTHLMEVPIAARKEAQLMQGLVLP